MAVFCTNCGTKAEEGAKMCTNCGAPLKVVPPVEEAPAPQPQVELPQADPNATYNGDAIQQNQTQVDNTPVNSTPVNEISVSETLANSMPNDIPTSEMPANGMPNNIPMNEMPAVGDATTVPTSQNSKKTLAIVIAAGVAVVVVFAIFIAIASGSSGYKSVIEDKLKAFEKSDAQKLAETYPEFWYIDEYDTIDDFAEEIEDSEFSEALIENLEEEVGSKIKLSYKIEKIDNLSDKKFDNFCEAIAEAHDCSTKKIKAIKKADIKVTAKGKDGKHEFDWEDVYLIKEGGDWYILNADLESGNIGNDGEYHIDFYKSYSYYLD